MKKVKVAIAQSSVNLRTGRFIRGIGTVEAENDDCERGDQREGGHEKNKNSGVDVRSRLRRIFGIRNR